MPLSIDAIQKYFFPKDFAAKYPIKTAVTPPHMALGNSNTMPYSKSSV